MHMHYAFGNHIYTLIYVTYVFLVWHTFMPITFNNIHICASLPNTNPYYMLSDSDRYFHWAAILFFHIYDHFCILWLKDILPGIIFCIHVCMYVYIYVHIHTFMQFCLFPSIHAYIYSDLFMSTYMHICMYGLMHARLQTYMHTYTYIYAHIIT